MFSNDLSSSQRVNRLKDLLYSSARGPSRVKEKVLSSVVQTAALVYEEDARITTLEGCGLLNV